jgi:large repetitive protein
MTLIFDNGYTITRNLVPIVTQNLLLHYNTLNTSSYNGSGTTITDISGNGRNGTITGSPTWTNNYFTFVDDYITTPNLSSLITSANETHSVELWVYPTNSGVLVQYNNTTSPNASYHHSAIEIVGGNLEVGLWNGSGLSSTGNIGAVSFNQWHQLVLTYNGSVCKGYIDGVYKGSVNVLWSSPMDSSMAFYMNFGYSTVTNHGDGTNFDGRFGTMRVYNKLFTDAEVLNNYNADKSKYGL